MSLNFPSNPADNDTYNGYVYNATKGVWNKIPTTTDSISEGDNNLYFTDQRALDATASAYDATGSAAAAESAANTYTDGEISTLDTSLKAYADTAESDAITSANSYTDTEIAALIGGAPELLNTLDEIAAAIADDENFSTTVVSDIAQGLTDAKAYTDTRETAITSAYQSYADTAEADAISTAAADATSKANTAESNANTYTDGREAAITTAYEAYADQAEADAISTASADATSKANTAESNANTYTDSLIGDVTVDGTDGNTVADRIATAVSSLVDSAPETLDTLNELAAALGDDASFSTTITNSIAAKADSASPSFTGTVNFSGATVSGLEISDLSDVFVEFTDADYRFLAWESINSRFEISRIGTDDLYDLSVSGENSPTDGQVLVYEEASSSWVPGEAGTTINSINDISDVDTSAKADGYVLTYNGTSSQWEAAAPTGGGADDNAIFKATLFFGGNA